MFTLATRLLAGFAALILVTPHPAGQAPPAPTFDILITNGTLHDGAGSPPRRADLGIKGDRIVAIGDLATAKARAAQVIDAKGLIVCPGFIDLHTHCEKIARSWYKENRNYLTQGVATVVTGNCGGGRTDTAAYLATIDKQGAGTNVAHLLPFGSLRRKAMGGSFDRPPTPAELERFKGLVDAGMRAGAWGLSTGLGYAPGAYTKTGEIIAVCKVVGRHGGIYATHMRSEGNQLLASVEESLEIGLRAGCPVHISHFKAARLPNYGKVRAACALIEWARGKGRQVTCDQYPYHASATSLAAFTIPTWARVGGNKALFKRLADPATGARIRGRIAATLQDRGGPATLLISSNRKNPKFNGMTLEAIAKAVGKTPVEAILWLQDGGAPRAISFSMADADVEFIMNRDYVATSSDGGCATPKIRKSGRILPNPSRPHPRSYGAFARKVGRYALEMKKLPLARAIRSGSGLPADIFRIPDRGYLRRGAYADILVFDPATFRDRATFTDPHRYSTGVIWLLVNGKAAIAAGKTTGALSGRALRPGPTQKR